MKDRSDLPLGRAVVLVVARSLAVGAQRGQSVCMHEWSEGDRVGHAAGPFEGFAVRFCQPKSAVAW
jgi:hypothetical protein